jgi:hypothetical protein
MDIRETYWEGVDWLNLALDRGQLWAFVSTVMILRVPLKAENLFPAE